MKKHSGLNRVNSRVVVGGGLICRADPGEVPFRKNHLLWKFKTPRGHSV